MRPAPLNALAIVSLVTGIAGLLVLPLVGAVVAIVAGHVARGQIDRTGEGGRGLATTGLLLGYVHLAVLAILIVAATALLVAGDPLWPAS